MSEESSKSKTKSYLGELLVASGSAMGEFLDRNNSLPLRYNEHLDKNEFILQTLPT